MPINKTYYEILGVSRTATSEQIKKRYRQLVRQHHPDVAVDKAAAQAAFIEITEAYQTLSNPNKRVIYDASLDAEMFRVPVDRPRHRPPSSTNAQTRRAQPRPAANRIAEAQKWVREAEAAFIRGQFRSAIWACKEAQKLDRRNVQAHTILGDIYRIQGQVENAIAMYTVAIQLDPRNADVQAKLNRLVRRSQSSAATASVAGTERQAALRMGLNLMGWSMVAFMFVLLAMSPGQPILWLQQNLPAVGIWTMMLFATLLIAGFLTGFLLSVNETVDQLDDELVFQSVHSPWPRPASYPMALLLIIFNFFNFYLAVTLYIVMGLVQECLSKSVLKAFLATFCLVVVASLVYSIDSAHVLMLGGNVVFPALLFGWAMGDMFRPGW